jgi:transcriptional regulator with XRE-family HTH domain
MSKLVDKTFRGRLEQACSHAKVAFSQSAIGKALTKDGQVVDRRTVARWFGEGLPSPEMLFRIADAFGVDARWLATGQGTMLPNGTGTKHEAHEEMLLEQYRAADPRWKLSLRLLASLANEDQIEAATDVDMVVARLLGKKPHEIKYVGDQEAGDKIGPLPGKKPAGQRS